MSDVKQTTVTQMSGIKNITATRQCNTASSVSQAEAPRQDSYTAIVRSKQKRTEYFVV